MRKYSEPLEDTANMLVTVPGGSDGPSGVLVCCENYLVYKNVGEQSDLRCPIPRRQHDLDDAERSMLFVCSATHRTKVRRRLHIFANYNDACVLQHMFFFLLQTEQGDIFKVTLEMEDDVVSNGQCVTVCKSLAVPICFVQVTELKIKYFDTVPVAASLCVLKTGFLYCASEFGNQCVISCKQDNC